MCYISVLLYRGLLSHVQQWLIDNRYISANVPKTDQVKNMFALMLGEMYPVGLCLYTSCRALPCILAQALGWAIGTCSVAFGFLNITGQVGFRSRKLWNQLAL